MSYSNYTISRELKRNLIFQSSCNLHLHTNELVNRNLSKDQQHFNRVHSFSAIRAKTLKYNIQWKAIRLHRKREKESKRSRVARQLLTQPASIMENSLSLCLSFSQDIDLNINFKFNQSFFITKREPRASNEKKNCSLNFLLIINFFFFLFQRYWTWHTTTWTV